MYFFYTVVSLTVSLRRKSHTYLMFFVYKVQLCCYSGKGTTTSLNGAIQAMLVIFFFCLRENDLNDFLCVK